MILALLLSFWTSAAEPALEDQLIPRHRELPKQKLTGEEDIKTAMPPRGKGKVELRFDFELSQPVSRVELEKLAGGTGREKDALLRALLRYAAPPGSKETRVSGCCIRMRYAGCAYSCCGSRASGCMEHCEVVWCDVKK